MQVVASLTWVAAGGGLEQQPPAEQGGDGQGGREGEAGEESHFWGAPGAECRRAARGPREGAGEPPVFV